MQNLATDRCCKVRCFKNLSFCLSCTGSINGKTFFLSESGRFEENEHGNRLLNASVSNSLND